MAKKNYSDLAHRVLPEILEDPNKEETQSAIVKIASQNGNETEDIEKLVFAEDKKNQSETDNELVNKIDESSSSSGGPCLHGHL